LNKNQIADLLCDPESDLFVLRATSMNAMLQNCLYQDDNIYMVIDENDLGKFFPAHLPIKE